MTRREAFAMAMTPFWLLAERPKTYKAKIKTKNGSKINTSVQAKDEAAAKVKIERRYPGCQFLSIEEVPNVRKDKEKATDDSL